VEMSSLRLCEIVKEDGFKCRILSLVRGSGRGKMFHLNSNSLLSIVFGVRFTKVITHKSFRGRGDRCCDGRTTQTIWL